MDGQGEVVMVMEIGSKRTYLKSIEGFGLLHAGRS